MISEKKKKGLTVSSTYKIQQISSKREKTWYRWNYFFITTPVYTKLMLNNQKKCDGKKIKLKIQIICIWFFVSCLQSRGWSSKRSFYFFGP